MVKHEQKNIKRFRGEKLALKRAAMDWMTGAAIKPPTGKPPGREPLRDITKQPASRKRPSPVEDIEEEEGEDGRGRYDVMDSGDEEVEEEADKYKAQLVTPSARRTPTDQEPTTVKQYRAIIRSYETHLLRAKRQPCAASKSALADKFLENEVKKYMKERFWKRCKFITCRETMEECMNEVSAQFAIEEEKKEHLQYATFQEEKA